MCVTKIRNKERETNFSQVSFLVNLFMGINFYMRLKKYLVTGVY